MASKNARYPKGFRASLFILVTPLLGLRVAAVLSNIVPETKNAALADQLTPASPRNNVKSNFHNNYSRIFYSPVSAQDRLIAQIKIISRMSTCEIGRASCRERV